MRLTSRIILVVALLGLGPSLGRAAEQAVPRLPAARLVAVEGVSITYRLKDYDGKVVRAVVPAQSTVDIQGRSADGTVRATLAAVDPKLPRQCRGCLFQINELEEILASFTAYILTY